MVDDSSSVRLVVVEIEGGGTTSGVTPGTSNKRLLPVVDSLVLCAYPINPAPFPMLTEQGCLRENNCLVYRTRNRRHGLGRHLTLSDIFQRVAGEPYVADSPPTPHSPVGQALGSTGWAKGPRPVIRMPALLTGRLLTYNPQPWPTFSTHRIPDTCASTHTPLHGLAHSLCAHSPPLGRETWCRSTTPIPSFSHHRHGV